MSGCISLCLDVYIQFPIYLSYIITVLPLFHAPPLYAVSSTDILSLNYFQRWYNGQTPIFVSQECNVLNFRAGPHEAPIRYTRSESRLERNSEVPNGYSRSGLRLELKCLIGEQSWSGFRLRSFLGSRSGLPIGIQSHITIRTNEAIKS